MQSRFSEIIKNKLSQIDEATTMQPPAQPQQQQVAQPGQQNQSQPGQVQQPQQDTPDISFTKTLKGLTYNNPNAAVQTLNTALKNSGNVPGMQDFFKNLGYDAQKGQFVYVQQKTAPQQQATPQNQQPGQPGQQPVQQKV